MIKKYKTCLLINIAIPDDSKVNTKTDMLCKYEDLEIEVSRIWKVRTKIVPVIIGKLRIITKGSEPSVALRSPVGHRTTEDGTNDPCTHHL